MCVLDNTFMNLTRVGFFGIYAGTFAGTMDIGKNSKVLLDDCHFVNNRANKNSGIATIHDNSLVIAKSSIFEQNICSFAQRVFEHRSCMHIKQSEICYSSCHFNTNYAGMGGSLVYTDKSRIRISHSSFLNTELDKYSLEKDIFMSANRVKIDQKLYILTTTFYHKNAIIHSNDSDFTTKACAENVIGSLDKKGVMLRESPYASGMFVFSFIST